MSEVQTLLTGLVFGESPRWHAGRLWFSDWGRQEVVATDLAGKSEVIVRMPSFPFSIDWLHDGRLLLTPGYSGQLLRREPDGELIPHADLTGLSIGWNEIVVDGRNNTYINAIGFDLRTGAAFVPGIIALVTPDGSVRQVADGFAFPNGMAVTPDNQTLIIAESYARRLTAFDIETSGNLSNRRVWANLGDGVPDGICLDAEGAVWYGDVPNKRCVHVREGGEILQTIHLDRACFACTLGGEEKQTLFMMAAEWSDSGRVIDNPPSGQVLTIQAPVPGAGWP